MNKKLEKKRRSIQYLTNKLASVQVQLDELKMELSGIATCVLGAALDEEEKCTANDHILDAQTMILAMAESSNYSISDEQVLNKKNRHKHLC